MLGSSPGEDPPPDSESKTPLATRLFLVGAVVVVVVVLIALQDVFRDILG